MKLGVMIATAATIVLAAAPAAAEEADTTTEMRCILVAANLVTMPEPKTRQRGLTMAFYFLGRLDKKFSAKALQEKLVEEAAAIDRAKLQEAAKICGEQLESRGAFLGDLGGKLSAPKPAAKPAE